MEILTLEREKWKTKYEESKIHIEISLKKFNKENNSNLTLENITELSSKNAPLGFNKILNINTPEDFNSAKSKLLASLGLMKKFLDSFMISRQNKEYWRIFFLTQHLLNCQIPFL